MNRFSQFVAAMICFTIAGFAGAETVSRADKNRMIQVSYGTIVGVERQKLKTQAGGGAVVGGLAGLAVQHGKSDKDKAGGAAAGALLGALLVHAAQGSHKVEAFTVQLNDGSTVKVIQDLADIDMGDCVSVEQGSTANIRRVSSAMCEQGAHLSDPQVRESHAQDADECSRAKEEVLKANTNDEFERGAKKVKILCD